jgi:hypothetical protein
MTNMIQVLDPVAPRHAAAVAPPAAADALATLRGATVGFIDNAKPNFSLLAEDLGRFLVERHGVARVIVHRKPSASIGAADEAIDALARDCDLVICGSGD